MSSPKHATHPHADDQKIKDAYRPASGIALGPIIRLVRSRYSQLLHTGYAGCRFVCKLPGGQLYYDSQLAADDDGSPTFTKKWSEVGKHGKLYHDGAHRGDTAWQPGGKPLDANTVPFFSLPLGFSSSPKWNRHFGTHVGPGDLAAVIYNNVVAYAVLGDFGGSNLGEGSLELQRQLGNETIINGVYNDVGIARDVVTIVFPRTRNDSVRTTESIAAAALPLYLNLIMDGVASAVVPMIGLPDATKQFQGFC